MCDCHRQIRIEVPVQIHEEMRAVGRQRRMTLADIVVTAVREWFGSTKDDHQPNPSNAAEAQDKGERHANS